MGNGIEYLYKFKYYLNFNQHTPFSIDQSVIINQVLKEFSYELQKVDEYSRIKGLYNCIIRLKREKEEKYRLEKSRGIDTKRYVNSSTKIGEDSTMR